MLKLIACVLMLIDHIGYFFYDFLPQDIAVLARVAGRLAFPLFAYSVALGFRRTRSPLRYLLRMALFAAAAEGIIRGTAVWAGFAFAPNVLITFTSAILVLIGYDLATRSWHDCVATMKLARSAAAPGMPPLDYPVRIPFGDTGLTPATGLALGTLAGAAGLALVLILRPDYGVYGLLHVLVFHQTAARIPAEELSRDQIDALRARTWIGIAAVNLLFFPFRILVQHIGMDWALIQLVSMLALPLLFLRLPDPKPGLAVKYGFYLFYPLHIALLMLLSHALR